MVNRADLVIIGVCVGLGLGILIALLIWCAIKWYKRCNHLQEGSNESRVPTLPIRMNGLGTSTDFSASLSNSTAAKESGDVVPNSLFFRKGQHSKDRFTRASGIPRFAYKYVDL